MKTSLDEMTWPEIEAALQETNAVIFPVGSTEQHGPHLPVNVDTFCTRYIAQEAAGKIVKFEYNALDVLLIDYIF